MKQLQNDGVIVFTKPNCSYCQTAKDLLKSKGIDFKEIDVNAREYNSLLSSYLSGQNTVPQIFFNQYPVGGEAELQRLEKNGQLDNLLKNITKQDTSIDFPPSDLPIEQLKADVEDVAMREFIPMSDGSRSTDREEIPILKFYSLFFGFWPNTFQYLHHWPLAYKLITYCHTMTVVTGKATQTLGAPLMCAVAFATSQAHGCSYCQVHTAATKGELSLNMVQKLLESQTKGASENKPLGEFEIALAELAGKASTNDVSDELLNKILLLNPTRGEDYIKATAKIASAFGFFNCFNDLVGLEIEGDWHDEVQSKISIDMGKHTPTKSNPDNLIYDLPKGILTFEDIIDRYETRVGEDYRQYLKANLGIVPNWIEQWWEEDYRSRHSYMYVELMGDGEHTLIKPELKHLMARVAAMVKDHQYLAAIEGFMAYRTADNKAASLKRIEQCYAVAAGIENSQSDLFSVAEKAALQLALISARVPLITPNKIVAPLKEQYNTSEIIHLITVCGLAGMLQRWTAVIKPEIETDVSQFYRENNLSLDHLTYKFPFTTEVANYVLQ